MAILSRERERPWLLETKSSDGIHARRAESRDVSGERGHERDSQGEPLIKDRSGNAVKLGFHKIRKAPGYGQADSHTDGDQDQHFPHHQPNDISSGGAERHADADFAGPPGDRVGHHAVEPDGREQCCEQSEGAGQASD